MSRETDQMRDMLLLACWHRVRRASRVLGTPYGVQQVDQRPLSQPQDGRFFFSFFFSVFLVSVPLFNFFLSRLLFLFLLVALVVGFALHLVRNVRQSSLRDRIAGRRVRQDEQNLHIAYSGQEAASRAASTGLHPRPRPRLVVSPPRSSPIG